MVWETKIEGPGVPIGSDYTLRVVVTDDGTSSGTPQDLAGVALEAVFKLPGVTAGASVIRVESADIETEPDEDGDTPLIENVVLVPLTDTLTSGKLAGEYSWAVWRTTDGATRPLAFGTIPFVAVPLPGA